MHISIANSQRIRFYPTQAAAQNLADANAEYADEGESYKVVKLPRGWVVEFHDEEGFIGHIG